MFPLSNWTELDVWLYIHQENIPVVPLYLAAPNGPSSSATASSIMVDDERLPLEPGERPQHALGPLPDARLLSAHRRGRERRPPQFRTSSARRSQARTSERQGRLIDQDGSAAMERKKQEGYF